MLSRSIKNVLSCRVVGRLRPSSVFFHTDEISIVGTKQDKDSSEYQVMNSSTLADTAPDWEWSHFLQISLTVNSFGVFVLFVCLS